MLGSGGAAGALARLGVSEGFPKEVTFTMRPAAKPEGRHAGWERKFYLRGKRSRKWEGKGASLGGTL